MTSLKISKVTKSELGGNGTWIMGETETLCFAAKVYKPDGPNDMHIGKRSGIAKLWIQHTSTRQTVYNYDRGLDVPPATEDVARLVQELSRILAGMAQ